MVKLKSKKILITSLVLGILPWVIVGSLISLDVLNNDMLIEFLAKVIGVLTALCLAGVLYALGLFEKKR